MKVILLSKIERLGSVGSEVIVKSGYARNFLFPQSKAVLATEKNIKIFKEQQHELQSKINLRTSEAKFHSEAINKLGSITITAKSSGIHGKLFGSISQSDIAKVITKSVGFKVSKSQIRLFNSRTLKFLGIYSIKVHIYDDIFANINVKIVNVIS